MSVNDTLRIVPVRVMLTEAERKALEKLAKERATTMSHVIRDALREYWDNH